MKRVVQQLFLAISILLLSGVSSFSAGSSPDIDSFQSNFNSESSGLKTQYSDFEACKISPSHQFDERLIKIDLTEIEEEEEADEKIFVSSKDFYSIDFLHSFELFAGSKNGGKLTVDQYFSCRSSKRWFVIFQVFRI